MAKDTVKPDSARIAKKKRRKPKKDIVNVLVAPSGFAKILLIGNQNCALFKEVAKEWDFYAQNVFLVTMLGVVIVKKIKKIKQNFSFFFYCYAFNVIGLSFLLRDNILVPTEDTKRETAKICLRE